MIDFIYGLGGRDLSLDDVKGVFRELAEAGRTGETEPLTRYVGLRE